MKNTFAKIIELEALKLQVLVTKKFDKLPALRIETFIEGDSLFVSYFFGDNKIRDRFFDSYNESHALDFIKHYAAFR